MTKYFTAKVMNLPNDQQIVNRQDTYWRALKTLPNFEIIEGQFKQKPVTAKKANEEGFVTIIKTEEKGSDVNLATHLLVDAFNHEFENAIVITGDSDLVTPIRMVKEQLNKIVCILNPVLLTGKYKRSKRNISELASVSSFHKDSIPERVLRNSQLPNIIDRSSRMIQKPKKWKYNS